MKIYEIPVAHSIYESKAIPRQLLEVIRLFKSKKFVIKKMSVNLVSGNEGCTVFDLILVHLDSILHFLGMHSFKNVKST